MPGMDEWVGWIGKQRNLAISLFCYLVADAFFSENRLLTYSILAMLIISGPLAVGKKGSQRITTVTLAIAMIGLGYASTIREGDYLEFVAYMVAVLFFLDMIYLISRALLVEQTRVTGDTLWAAINIYLLFGMMFAFLYSAVLALHPGAFAGGILENDSLDITQSMVYYSFVTMTTLGYGDITPKIQVAATLAYVQALIGQLYVAILIARLVSMYSSQPDKD
jgi:hypothetical protein